MLCTKERQSEYVGTLKERQARQSLCMGNIVPMQFQWMMPPLLPKVKKLGEVSEYRVRPFDMPIRIARRFSVVLWFMEGTVSFLLMFLTFCRTVEHQYNEVSKTLNLLRYIEISPHQNLAFSMQKHSRSSQLLVRWQCANCGCKHSSKIIIFLWVK